MDPGNEFYINLFPEGMGVAGSDSPDKFPYAFGVYQGNWERACKIYRSWALKQRWTAKGPISLRDDVPAILKNIGIWLVLSNEEKDNIDNTRSLVSEAENAASQLKVPVGVHWYNWHHMPFDNEYPHFFPGKSEIKESFRGLAGKGFLIMPYINGMISDYDNKDSKAFLPHSTKDECGVPRVTFVGNTIRQNGNHVSLTKILA